MPLKMCKKNNISRENRPLPRTFLPSSIFLHHSETLHGYKLPIVSSHTNGRLGNVMGEYATLYALDKIYPGTMLTSKKTHNRLSKLFPHISLQSISILQKGKFMC